MSFKTDIVSIDFPSCGHAIYKGEFQYIANTDGELFESLTDIEKLEMLWKDIGDNINELKKKEKEEQEKEDFKKIIASIEQNINPDSWALVVKYKELL